MGPFEMRMVVGFVQLMNEPVLLSRNVTRESVVPDVVKTPKPVSHGPDATRLPLASHWYAEYWHGLLLPMAENDW